jgi:hypothetical protein
MYEGAMMMCMELCWENWLYDGRLELALLEVIVMIVDCMMIRVSSVIITTVNCDVIL